ncbi:DNA-binding protein [Brevibacterium permense]|uniref:helix-turn-helix transcriptional regulator n=1 Tax=Brevibacterium permense TaxID=234834 RepID=UPI0034E2844F|nr:DNA-binding protein [Brevibacterium permense]
MTRAQVAEYLQVSVSTLSRWARDGIGPRCIYLAASTPRYRREDVREFIDESG